MIGGGIQLTLKIGPAVPVPAPRQILDALESVQVNDYSGDQPSGFQLVFSLEKNSPLNTIFFLSPGSSSIPILRVVIIVTISGKPLQLIDGVVTKQDLQPGSDGKPSQLTITGTDLTAVMDFVDLDGIPYPAMPHSARVLLVLAKYAALGVIPKVIPSFVMDITIPIERIPRQKGSDLKYIQTLASEVGHVFYMEPGPAVGTTIAYWGPEIRLGTPQPALTMDMDAHTNVESMSFSYRKDDYTIPIVFIQEKMSKVLIPIPIPDISPLKPPLGAIPPIPPKLPLLSDTAHMSPVGALLRGVSYVTGNSDLIECNGELDVLRYGNILKSRRLVGVRGVGRAFDGRYFVKSVTHNIRRGSYKQSFALQRDWLLSNVSKVPT